MSAPEGILLEDRGIEARYDAEVAAAAFERAEETRVARAGGGNDGAVAEDDFVGFDVVAGEAIAP